MLKYKIYIGDIRKCTVSFFSTLSKYFLKSFFSWFSGVLFSILGIISLIETIECLRTIDSNTKLSVFKGIRLSIFRALEHIPILLPFFAFFASILLMIKMNENKELIIIKSLGISFKQIAKVLTISLAFFGIIYLFVLSPILASFHTKLVRTERVLFPQKRDSMSILPSGIWIRENNSTSNKIFNATKFDLKKGIFSNVTIFELEPNSSKLLRLLNAKKARLLDKKFKLFDVKIFKNNISFIEDSAMQEFNQKTHLSIKTLENMQDPPEAFSFVGLYLFIENGKKIGMSLLKYNIYFHNYIARILMMIAMSVLGISLTWNVSRFNKASLLFAGGVFLSLIIHFFNNVLIGMGCTGRLSVFISCYILPIVTIFTAFGIVLHQED